MNAGYQDPLHDDAPPDSVWSRGNYEEAMPNVMTPLTWSVWSDGTEDGVARAYRELGVYPLRRPQPRLQGVFFGRLAGRVDAQARALRHLPGLDPQSFLETMYSIPPGTVDVQKTNRRLAIVAAKAPVSFLRTPARLRRLQADAGSWWARTTARPIDPDDAPRVLREALAVFAEAFHAHTLASTFGPVLFGEIAKLTARAGRPELAGLLTTSGNARENEMLTDVWRMSQGDLTMSRFLERHGFYGPEPAEVAVPSWRADPAPLNALIKSAENPGVEPPEKRVREQVAKRSAAKRELLSALPARERPFARLLLSLASHRVATREVGKAAFLQAYDGVRHAAAGLGEDLQERGVLADRGDVVLFTLSELQHPLPPNAQQIADYRRERRDSYRQISPPLVWTGAPEPTSETLDQVQTAEPIAGMGVSAGEITGIARVVVDPLTWNTPLGPDEILVTRTTDPSWAAIFMAAGGLVVDLGNAMSHAAIVARELGIPCVIGVGNATGRIVDGTEIRIDGSTGAVELLN